MNVCDYAVMLHFSQYIVITNAFNICIAAALLSGWVMEIIWSYIQPFLRVYCTPGDMSSEQLDGFITMLLNHLGVYYCQNTELVRYKCCIPGLVNVSMQPSSVFLIS